MKYKCPSCEKTHDISIKKITTWLEASEPGRKAVASFLGRLNQKKASKVRDPAKYSRGSDGGRKAAAARWEKRKKAQEAS